MKTIFKLHEKDIQNIIDKASAHILKEEFDIIENKQKEIVKLTENDVRKLADRSYNQVMKRHFL